MLPGAYRWWLLLAVGLFTVGILLGIMFPLDLALVVGDNASAIDQLADMLAPMPGASLWLFIFLKNVSAVALSFLLSPLLLIVPLLALTVNGWLLGWVAVRVVEEKSLAYLLAGIIPHGVFELPAFFIGEAAAISFGVAVMAAVVRRGKAGNLGQAARLSWRLVGISVLLFLVASAIEAFVTPLILNAVK